MFTRITAHIAIEHAPDFDPDLSYLTDQDGKGQAHKDADQAHITAYNKGDWHMIGILASARLCGHTSQGGYQLLGTIHSSGLWGIESDTQAGLVKEFENAQLKELRDILTNLNPNIQEEDDPS